MSEVQEKESIGKIKPFFRNDPYVSILTLLAVFFTSQILAAVLVSLYPAVQSWTDAQSSDWLSNSVGAQFVYVLLTEVIAISLILWIVKVVGVAKKRIGLVKPRFSDFGWALVAYGLYFLCFIAISVLAKALIPALDFEQEQKNGFENAYSEFQLLLTFVSLVLLVPLAEEIMFRGFLFTSMRAKFNFRNSAIITSVVFGLAHLQFGAETPLLWVAALDTFILSLFMCKLREEEQSLWPPIFLHCIKNLTAFLILFGPRF